MKNVKRSLQIEQLDKKIKVFSRLESFAPSHGWIYAARTAMGLSLEQLARKMNITAQSVKEIEQREREGTISLNSLNDAAKAMGLKLTYGLSAPEKSLEKMIETRARQFAEKIVLRTHKTMQLENQANSRARLKRAIKEKTAELSSQKTKYLWD